MPRIQSGDVIKVRVHFTNPPKPKILICVSPSISDGKGQFFVINSVPFRLASNAQLEIARSELDCLDRKVVHRYV